LIIEFSNGACDGEPLLYSPPSGMAPGTAQGGSRKAACANLLAQNDVDPDLWYVYGLILCGIFLGFRLLALVLLTRRARGFALA